MYIFIHLLNESKAYKCKIIMQQETKYFKIHVKYHILHYIPVRELGSWYGDIIAGKAVGVRGPLVRAPSSLDKGFLVGDSAVSLCSGRAAKSLGCLGLLSDEPMMSSDSWLAWLIAERKVDIGVEKIDGALMATAG